MAIDFLTNFNDKVNSYITNNETGNVIAKLSDLSTLGEAHRFSNVFATQIKAYIATTGADLGPAKAVEKMFEVEVESVNVINMKRKPKRLGVHSGYTAEWKKAIVTLTADSKTIEFFDGLN